MLSCNIPGVDISDFCSLKLYSMVLHRSDMQVGELSQRSAKRNVWFETVLDEGTEGRVTSGICGDQEGACDTKDAVHERRRAVYVIFALWVFNSMGGFYFCHSQGLVVRRKKEGQSVGHQLGK